jgi:Flp pilus assembly protein TadG
MARLHRRQRQGNYAILTGLVMTSLLGFGALAVDSAWIRLAALQAQAAADAGSHAAILELRQAGDIDQSREVARAVINRNMIHGIMADVEPETDIVFGVWDFSDRSFVESEDAAVNAVQVTVRKTHDSPNGAVNTLMMRLFGPSHINAEASVPSTSALRFREILIVQDVTGSFLDEIEFAKEGNLAFLDSINEKQIPGDQIGMVTFVGAAEVWTKLDYVRTAYDEIRAQWSTLDWCDRSYAPYATRSYPVYHYAPQMMPCNSGSPPSRWWYDSGTDQSTGLAAALDVLTDESLTNSYSMKTVVLVSDGKPQCVPSSAVCDSARAAAGISIANMLADEGITIFSVSYNSTYNATQSAYMESLVRGYGDFYETPDASELPAILEEIAQSIPVAVVK